MSSDMGILSTNLNTLKMGNYLARVKILKH